MDEVLINTIDDVYLDLCDEILAFGHLSENRTSNKTYKICHKMLSVYLDDDEIPILTTKRVSFKCAVNELLWIFQQQSNDINWLHERNIHIWDEWAMDNNTIGESYGYVIKNYNQLDNLIHTLKTDPYSRRMIMDLWQIPHLNKGALYPCCFLTMWDVFNGYLNCALVIRSSDVPIGLPHNLVQYSVLVYLIAQVTGLIPGIFSVFINNAHIYENQISGINEQQTRRNEQYQMPKLVINKDIKNFYDFTIDDIRLEGYESHPKIKFDISV